jgi:hypothetical protein
MKSYSVLPTCDHDEDCSHHDDEQPTTVEIWVRKDDDDDVIAMAVNPDESTEWLNGFTDGGSMTYEKKNITGLLLQFGYAPTSEWETIDLLGDECTRSFKLISTPESNE